MKKNLLFTLTGTAMLALILVGCSRSPQQELLSAQQALDNAVVAEADIYVQDLFLSAQDSLESARIEIEAQNANSWYSRSYRRAEEMIQFTTQTATHAAEQVGVQKEEVRLAAEALISQADEAIAMSTSLLSQTPRGKEGNILLASLSSDIDAARADLALARMSMENGRYADARIQAQSALDMALSLSNEMNTAISKTRSARG